MLCIEYCCVYELVLFNPRHPVDGLIHGWTSDVVADVFITPFVKRMALCSISWVWGMKVGLTDICCFMSSHCVEQWEHFYKNSEPLEKTNLKSLLVDAIFISSSLCDGALHHILLKLNPLWQRIIRPGEEELCFLRKAGLSVLYQHVSLHLISFQCAASTNDSGQCSTNVFYREHSFSLMSQGTWDTRTNDTWM